MKKAVLFQKTSLMSAGNQKPLAPSAASTTPVLITVVLLVWWSQPPGSERRPSSPTMPAGG
jgi:hypothetical protein